MSSDTPSIPPTPPVFENPTKPLMRPHNLLILNDPEKKSNYKDWQAEVDRLSKKTVRKSGMEVGYEQDIDQNLLKNLKATPKEFLPKELPPSFCPYCNSHDVPRETPKCGPSLFMFANSYEGVGIREDEAVRHYMCEPCAIEEFFPQHKELMLPGDWWDDKRQSRHAQIEERIIEYVRSQRAKGVDGSIFGDESRIERYKEYDD